MEDQNNSNNDRNQTQVLKKVKKNQVIYFLLGYLKVFW